MKKTWTISYGKADRNGNLNWMAHSYNRISKQNAELDLKRAVENDRHDYDWALFEMVAAFTVKKEVVAAEIEELNVVPLEAVPGPMPAGRNPDDGEGLAFFPDFDEDLEDNF
jgi:hypothetical protein